MKIFGQIYFHIEACLLYILQFYFLARLGLLLCDFYLKIKKNKTTRNNEIEYRFFCLCPSILHNSRMQDLDHMLRGKHLGAADMQQSHPADLSRSYARDIG
jgi:hypothetical protein